MPTLTKRDIVVAVSNETEVTQADVCRIIERALDLIVRSLSEGRPVELRNFGVFEVRVSKERTRRDPNDPDQSLTSPPRATVRFKCGKVMREQLEHGLGLGEKPSQPEPVVARPIVRRLPKRELAKREVAKAA